MNFTPPTDWPIWALLTFIFLTSSLPNIMKFAGSIFQAWIPMRAQERERIAKYKEEADSRENELQEREVLAQEKLTTTLILIQDQLQEYRKDHASLIGGLEKANMTLGVLLDRSTRTREDFEKRTKK